jgi:hypothetical protein
MIGARAMARVRSSTSSLGWLGAGNRASRGRDRSAQSAAARRKKGPTGFSRAVMGPHAGNLSGAAAQLRLNPVGPQPARWKLHRASFCINEASSRTMRANCPIVKYGILRRSSIDRERRRPHRSLGGPWCRQPGPPRQTSQRPVGSTLRIACAARSESAAVPACSARCWRRCARYSAA